MRHKKFHEYNCAHSRLKRAAVLALAFLIVAGKAWTLTQPNTEPVQLQSPKRARINSPPYINTIGQFIVKEGEELSFTVTAVDRDSRAVLILTVYNLPRGASFIDNGNRTGSFRWTPGFDQAGDYTEIYFKVSDKKFTDTESTRIRVDPVNTAPAISITNSPAQAIDEGDSANPYRVELGFNDSEGDVLDLSGEFKRFPNTEWEPLTVLGETNYTMGQDNLANTGFFDWLPTFEQAGQYEFRFTVIEISTPEQFAASVTAAPLTVNDANPPLADLELLDTLQAKAAKYFMEQVFPASGFVLDISSNQNNSSVAATGFGLAVLPVIAERSGTTPNWTYTYEEARARAELILDNLLLIQQNQASSEALYGKAGFFYHFLNPSLERLNTQTEVSIIDTAIVLAGALTAGNYFGGAVKTKAEQIFDNVN